MNFLINILSTIFNKFISRSNKQINNLDTNVNVTRQENTNAVAEATAAIIWICAVTLAIFWIPQYITADVFWIKNCIAQGHIVKFPLDIDKLFEMICSLLGLSGLGIIHKLVKRL